MSEEVIIVDEVVGDTMFVLRLDSCIALFDQDNARLLRDNLNEFLGMDKQPGNILWKVGDEIAHFSQEPDLPIGSQITDSSTYKDKAERTEDGWMWLTLLGNIHKANDKDPWPWEAWNEQAWTVTRVGK